MKKNRDDFRLMLSGNIQHKLSDIEEFFKDIEEEHQIYKKDFDLVIDTGKEEHKGIIKAIKNERLFINDVYKIFEEVDKKNMTVDDFCKKALKVHSKYFHSIDAPKNLARIDEKAEENSESLIENQPQTPKGDGNVEVKTKGKKGQNPFEEDPEEPPQLTKEEIARTFFVKEKQLDSSQDTPKQNEVPEKKPTEPGKPSLINISVKDIEGDKSQDKEEGKEVSPIEGDSDDNPWAKNDEPSDFKFGSDSKADQGESPDPFSAEFPGIKKKQVETQQKPKEVVQFFEESPEQKKKVDNFFESDKKPTKESNGAKIEKKKKIDPSKVFSDPKVEIDVEDPKEAEAEKENSDDFDFGDNNNDEPKDDFFSGFEETKGGKEGIKQSANFYFAEEINPNDPKDQVKFEDNFFGEDQDQNLEGEGRPKLDQENFEDKSFREDNPNSSPDWGVNKPAVITPHQNEEESSDEDIWAAVDKPKKNEQKAGEKLPPKDQSLAKAPVVETKRVEKQEPVEKPAPIETSSGVKENSVVADNLKLLLDDDKNEDLHVPGGRRIRGSMSRLQGSEHSGSQDKNRSHSQAESLRGHSIRGSSRHKRDCNVKIVDRSTGKIILGNSFAHENESGKKVDTNIVLRDVIPPFAENKLESAPLPKTVLSKIEINKDEEEEEKEFFTPRSEAKPLGSSAFADMEESKHTDTVVEESLRESHFFEKPEPVYTENVLEGLNRIEPSNEPIQPTKTKISPIDIPEVKHRSIPDDPFKKSKDTVVDSRKSEQEAYAQNQIRNLLDSKDSEISALMNKLSELKTQLLNQEERYEEELLKQVYQAEVSQKEVNFLRQRIEELNTKGDDELLDQLKEDNLRYMHEVQDKDLAIKELESSGNKERVGFEKKTAELQGEILKLKERNQKVNQDYNELSLKNTKLAMEIKHLKKENTEEDMVHQKYHDLLIELETAKLDKQSQAEEIETLENTNKEYELLLKDIQEENKEIRTAAEANYKLIKDGHLVEKLEMIESHRGEMNELIAKIKEREKEIIQLKGELYKSEKNVGMPSPSATTPTNGKKFSYEEQSASRNIIEGFEVEIKQLRETNIKITVDLECMRDEIKRRDLLLEEQECRLEKLGKDLNETREDNYQRVKDCYAKEKELTDGQARFAELMVKYTTAMKRLELQEEKESQLRQELNDYHARLMSLNSKQESNETNKNEQQLDETEATRLRELNRMNEEYIAKLQQEAVSLRQAMMEKEVDQSLLSTANSIDLTNLKFLEEDNQRLKQALYRKQEEIMALEGQLLDNDILEGQVLKLHQEGSLLKSLILHPENYDEHSANEIKEKLGFEELVLEKKAKAPQTVLVTSTNIAEQKSKAVSLTYSAEPIESTRAKLPEIEHSMKPVQEPTKDRPSQPSLREPVLLTSEPLRPVAKEPTNYQEQLARLPEDLMEAELFREVCLQRNGLFYDNGVINLFLEYLNPCSSVSKDCYDLHIRVVTSTPIEIKSCSLSNFSKESLTLEFEEVSARNVTVENNHLFEFRVLFPLTEFLQTPTLELHYADSEGKNIAVKTLIPLTSFNFFELGMQDPSDTRGEFNGKAEGGHAIAIKHEQADYLVGKRL
jgi:hypothetical protein